MSTLLVVGAGNIGVRHLESLLEANESAAIVVVDELPAARMAAERVWKTSSYKGRFQALASLDDLPHVTDLAVVATNSKPRATIVHKLLGQGVKNFILEKFLFPDLASYDNVLASLKAAEAKAWVNCPRRLFPGNEVLASELRGKHLHYQVRANSTWGMACNAIHFLDHLAFLTGDPPLTRVDNSRLEPGSTPSRRPGYIEFLGTLKVELGQQTFTASAADPWGDKIITIIDESGRRVVIDESRSQMLFEDGRVRSWHVPYQSELTAAVVRDILSRGACALTGYEYSASLHRPLLRGFLEHLTPKNEPDLALCPIT